MTKRDYPKEISQDEWLKSQNFFLEEQNMINRTMRDAKK